MCALFLLLILAHCTHGSCRLPSSPVLNPPPLCIVTQLLKQQADKPPHFPLSVACKRYVPQRLSAANAVARYAVLIFLFLFFAQDPESTVPVCLCVCVCVCACRLIRAFSLVNFDGMYRGVEGVLSRLASGGQEEQQGV